MNLTEEKSQTIRNMEKDEKSIIHDSRNIELKCNNLNYTKPNIC